MYGEQSGDPKRRIRVLWLIKGLGPGGAEQLLLLAAKVADRDAFDYSIAYVRPDKTHLIPEFVALGLQPRRLGADAAGPLGWLSDLRDALAQADVVHVHSPVLAAAARLVAQTVRPRPVVVTTEHNEWSSHRLPTRLANAMTGPFDKATWAVSDQVKETVWPALRGRFEVLIHGIDLTPPAVGKPREDTRRALGLNEDDVVSLTVANLRKNKDYPNLFAAAQLACQANPRLHFLAVGQGPLEDELRDLHATTGLGERFRFLGYRRDIPDLMAASDIFTLGSAHEGLPVAIMEAFAAGLPVVATAVGGVPDQVRDGVEGIIVPPGNPVALGDALIRIAGHADLRARLAANARTRASVYDIRTAVHTQEQRYIQLTSGGTHQREV